MEDANNADCVILAVAHKEFKAMTLNDIDQMFVNGNNSEKVLIDFKSILNKEQVEAAGYRYWRL